jgi:periplasmic protein TonB
MKQLLLIFFLLLTMMSHGQTIIHEEKDTAIRAVYTFVENMPQFPGGKDSMQNFINRNMQQPVQTKKYGFEGTERVAFIVEKDGKVTDVHVLNDVGEGCADEAIRIVKLMPNWIPGRQGGKVMRVETHILIYFHFYAE